LKSFYLGFTGHSGFTLEPVSENSLTAVNFAHFPLTAQHQFEPVILAHVHSLLSAKPLLVNVKPVLPVTPLPLLMLLALALIF
jgi:hypothetical protein